MFRASRAVLSDLARTWEKSDDICHELTCNHNVVELDWYFFHMAKQKAIATDILEAKICKCVADAESSHTTIRYIKKFDRS
jgi:hypothetical protein